MAKISRKVDFWVDVSVVDPDGESCVVKMKFKHLSTSDFEALEVGRHGEGIANLVIDWDGEDFGEAFSSDAMAALINDTPWLPMSMFRSYATARQGFISKN